MVEWDKNTILVLICATVVLIGSLVGWWSIRETIMGISVSAGFNPFFGMRVVGTLLISPTVLTILAGLIALIGGSLIFPAIKKPALGIIGGILAIAGPILFIAAFYIDGIGTGYPLTPLNLFDSAQISSLYITSFLGVGWFMCVIGGIVGIVGSTKVEKPL